MKRLIIINLFLYFTFWGFSQHNIPLIDASKGEQGGVHSSTFSVEPLGSIPPQRMDSDWMPFITHSAIKHSRKENELIERIKTEKTALKLSLGAYGSQNEPRSGGGNPPSVAREFQANIPSGSCPMDNTLAISDDGMIVSCINSNIAYYNSWGNLIYTTGLWSFFNNPGLPSSICDPKVYYDPGEDRFVLFSQVCDGISANSKVLLAFSKSNDPSQGWWLYELTGNPRNDGSWFDYPKLAVSTHELIITGNLFYQSGGFNQAVIYQIDKMAGYSGGSMDWQYWHNISASPFTLLPLSYGQNGTTGPGVLLVSTELSSSGSNNINLYQITDVQSAPNEALNHWNVNTSTYSTGGNATQSGGGLIDTGDNRALSGFYMDDIIHFVFHSDIGNGWNGINYNRLNIQTLTNTSSTFGLQGTYDYCYPAVASYSNSQNDHSVVIGFERSGPNIYPQYRVVHCDNGGNWSPSVLVQQGYSGIVNACGSPERWGDYTGISRKQNSSSPTVWIAGAYANSNNYWGNWIAEITENPVGVEDGSDPDLKVFPNPIIDVFKTEFSVDQLEPISVVIMDYKGTIVKRLYDGYANPGINTFTFNKGNLSAGAYFLQIKNHHKAILKNEKIIVSK